LRGYAQKFLPLERGKDKVKNSSAGVETKKVSK
jgi:hypothetical protein